MRALKRRILVAAALVVGVSVPLFVAAAPTQAANPGLTFTMVRSAGAVNANCLTNATATVHVVSHELTETMTVRAAGCPRTPSSTSSSPSFPTHRSACRGTRAICRPTAMDGPQ